jgi:energy-coupling factor transporter ATP-binding protein EcfA2
MILQDIFLKPVDRHIDGVIKADDERSLVTEVEEYVVTRELRTAIDGFINYYSESPVVNGAWISGFFGSGKSHLLKMLALLLENRQIDGHSTFEMFLPKLADDAVLRGNLEKVCRTPSKSILFNIAQKANIVNKKHSDALLGTFIKVFDEMCGYYGKQGYIAQFERDLDSRNLLQRFKEEYRKIADLDWERGREQDIFESRNISEAYAKVSGNDIKDSLGVLEHYRTHYKKSIEDFAEMVNDYIQKQEAGFRLNFFVDEVGQYIADNVRLMTDLQTIAESLATRCNGRAWIIVTAQEDMDTILGRMRQKTGDDFSKIQDRFKCKMKLTGANVDEVIRLRLLAKNDTGRDILDSLYIAQQNNLKTLFDLPDGAKKYKNFKDREHFVSSYPFIPYQFTLFQSAIQNLSKHDAFTGKYQSVGERSMLEVFQFVAKSIAKAEVGELATFDLMFEGVRDVIKANVRWGITQSEQLMEDEFTKRVLKVLFLVKYVKEFQATARNLTVLLIERFESDPQVLRRRVEESLGILEQQTYIKRNEELYEYLTDKERDIENEIKNTDVDPAGINGQMAAMFYTSTLNLNKIRYDVNGQDFPFTKRLDNHALGREYELGIHLMTENQGKENFRYLSLQHEELVVALPSDDQFYKETRLFLQTDTYIKQNASNAASAEESAILTDKSHQNQARYEWLKRRAYELLGNADMYVMGEDVRSEVSDAKMRISYGFQKLIEKVYPNLAMLGEVHYEEKDIAKHLRAGKDFLDEAFNTIAPAELEMLSFINSQKINGIKVTLHSLIEKFEHKPNGWPVAAILCLVARLFGMAKIEVVLDKPLEESTIEKTIRNTAYHNNIIILPVADISPSKVKRLKDVYSHVFHQPPKSNEAKALAGEFASEVEKKYQELDKLLARVETFTFLAQLGPVITVLKNLRSKTYDWYYANLDAFADELLDLTDDVIDPMLTFMKGEQGKIYEQAKKFLNEQQHNLYYLEGDEKKQLKEILDNPACFRTQQMSDAKSLTEVLEDKLKRKLKTIKGSYTDDIKSMKAKLEGMAEFEHLSADRKREVEDKFVSIMRLVDRSDQIAMINDQFSTFRDSTYPTLIGNIQEWGNLREPPKPYNPRPGDPLNIKKPTPKKIVPAREVKVQFKKALLYDEKDVEEYVQSLTKALLAELEKGNNIQV